MKYYVNIQGVTNQLKPEGADLSSAICNKTECLQKVHEHFCSIYRPNIDPHFEKYVANIDQNHKVSEKYEHGQNLAKIKQENDLQAGKMSTFYR